MGQPKNNVPWSACEARAFEQFADANDLAEALFAPGQLGRDATAAILSISHTSMNQVSWFERWGHALVVRPPVWIIRQENYDADMKEFLRRIDQLNPQAVSHNPTARHANDYSGVPDLSQAAITNLQKWYCQDFAFYDLCEDWLEKHQNTSGESPVNQQGFRR
jgi:hypothetical protein